MFILPLMQIVHPYFFSQNFELKEKLEEAYLVADAFRKAFEDQLNRNSALSKQLADSSDGAQKEVDKNGKRRKALMSWLKKKDWRNGMLATLWSV